MNCGTALPVGAIRAPDNQMNAVQVRVNGVGRLKQSANPSVVRRSFTV